MSDGLSLALFLSLRIVSDRKIVLSILVPVLRERCGSRGRSRVLCYSRERSFAFSAVPRSSGHPSAKPTSLSSALYHARVRPRARSRARTHARPHARTHVRTHARTRERANATLPVLLVGIPGFGVRRLRRCYRPLRDLFPSPLPSSSSLRRRPRPPRPPPPPPLPLPLRSPPPSSSCSR